MSVTKLNVNAGVIISFQILWKNSYFFKRVYVFSFLLCFVICGFVSTENFNGTYDGNESYHQSNETILESSVNNESIYGCPTQFSRNIQTNTSDIEWESDWHKKNVISNPICLNQNLAIVNRDCNDHIWSPIDPPDCFDVVNFCGVGHSLDTNFHKPRCIFITEKMEFKKHPCPIGFRHIDTYRDYSTIPYWDTPIIDDSSFNIENNTLDIQCSVSVNGSTYLTSCKNRYHFICAYILEVEIITYRCPSNCVPSMPWENKCLCLNESKSALPSDKFCKKIAKISFHLELTTLTNYLTKESCWVNTSNSVTKNIRNSTFYPAINKYGLVFREGSLKCAICEESPLPFETVKMELKFHEKRKKLILTVYSATSLYYEREHLFTCFTDASNMLRKNITFEVNSSKLRHTMSFKIPLEKYPGQYWCEGYQLPNLETVTSNVVVAYKKLKGNEYSLRLNQTFPISCTQFLHNDYRDDDTTQSVSTFLAIEKSLEYADIFVKPMQIYKMEAPDWFCQMDILLHITSTNKRDVIKEYFQFKDSLTKTFSEIKYFRSSFFCVPENYNNLGQILSWRLTKIGTKGLPKQFCIQESGLPVTRTCSGTFLEGGVWDDVDGTCSKQANVSKESKKLYSIYTQTTNGSLLPQIAENVSILSENAKTFSSLDVFFTANILREVIVQNTNVSVETVSKTIENMMLVDRKKLEEAQNLYDSTDDFLRALDYFLAQDNLFSTTQTNLDNQDMHCNANICPSNYFMIKKRKVVLQSSRPYYNDITGLAIYDSGKTFKSDEEFDSQSEENYDPHTLHESSIQILYKNSSLNEIEQSSLLAATFVQAELLEEIWETMTTEEEKMNLIINIVVFYNDTLFISKETATNKTIGSLVVSVSIPGYGEVLESPIPLLLRSSGEEKSCVFWNYSSSLDLWENKTSHWSQTGGDYSNLSLDNNLDLCQFTHLTHFALLLRSNKEELDLPGYITKEDELMYHDAALTYITIIGCSFSLVGIVGIFLTAFKLEKWRSKLGSKILINMSIAIAVEIVVAQVAGLDDLKTRTTNVGCVVIGILLQYAVLAKFFWMLISAYLQHLRFINVLQPVQDHFLMKSMVIGWGLPAIPTLLVAVITPNSYKSAVYQLCYPNGWSLYIGILFPILIIVSINGMIFWKIMNNIRKVGQSLDAKMSTGNSDKASEAMRKHTKGNFKRRICLAILLFFLLGMPWVFGILAEVIQLGLFEVIFAYLFCFFATLQGFVLFLFYIVLDRETKDMWRRCWKKKE